MTTHTPGPWLVGPRTEFHEGLNIWAGSFYVGKVVADKTASNPDQLEEANARLIAAAPELLKNLKTVLAELQEAAITYRIRWTPVGITMLASAQEAIAKAEGK